MLLFCTLFFCQPNHYLTFLVIVSGDQCFLHTRGGARGARLLGHRITMGAPKSPNNVTITFFNTVYLLQKDRFEHVLAKHASCPGPQITSLRPWFTRYHRFPAGVPFVAMLRGAAICSYFTSTVINVTFLAKQLWVGQCMVQKYFSSVGCRKHG